MNAVRLVARRYYIKTLGCKVNRVESDTLASELFANGCNPSDEASADVIIINTCTVTSEADTKVRKAVRHALAANDQAIVIATGCATYYAGETLAHMDTRVKIVGDKSMLLNEVLAAFSSVDACANDKSVSGSRRTVGAAHEVPAEIRAADGELGLRTRTPIKIQDGCDNFCSFCVISRVRGPVWSASVDEVVSSVVRADAPEVILTGINLARFCDPATNEDLASLVNRLTALAGPRIRLSSIEPPDLQPRLLDALSSSYVAPHLHVPLQSGSDAVLSAMGRKYTTDEYLTWITRAKEAIANLTITTDVIVGFPGETEEDFEQTLAFCERVGFSKIHVFKYSPREHTPAATFEKQVDPMVKNERALRLREVSEALRGQFMAHLGLGPAAQSREEKRSFDVVVESVGPQSARGTSGEYIQLEFAPISVVAPGDRVIVSASQVLEST